jgi:hypothetical protein
MIFKVSSKMFKIAHCRGVCDRNERQLCKGNWAVLSNIRCQITRTKAKSDYNKVGLPINIMFKHIKQSRTTAKSDYRSLILKPSYNIVISTCMYMYYVLIVRPT